MPWQAWLMLKSTAGKIKSQNEYIVESLILDIRWNWKYLCKLFEDVLFIYILKILV